MAHELQNKVLHCGNNYNNETQSVSIQGASQFMRWKRNSWALAQFIDYEIATPTARNDGGIWWLAIDG